MQQIYKAKSFKLSGLQGISDKTLEMHFKLYEGYVKNTNLLNEKIAEILKDGKVDQEENAEFSEFKRRFGFEYNGLVLHEYYFGNLSSNGQGRPEKNSPFLKAAESSFGDYEVWKADFVSTGQMRGVGWAICFEDFEGRLSNHWVTLHEMGNVAGFRPILVMDVWEHAYLLDYKPAERGKYIEAFFSNIDWTAAEERLAGEIAPTSKSAESRARSQRGSHHAEARF